MLAASCRLCRLAVAPGDMALHVLPILTTSTDKARVAPFARYILLNPLIP